MFQPELNKDFSAKQIVDFVLDNDKRQIYKSEALNKEKFAEAIRRLDKLGFIIVFRNGNNLQGVLGYYFLTDENKHEASKANWRLPDNVTDGDILYLSFIATKGDCDIVAIKTMFEQMGYRNRITRRRGYTKGAWYEYKIARKKEII